MKTISVHQFCIYHNIPQSFIDSLSNFELIELIEEENTKYIPLKEIGRVERLMRMHYELEVNMEGLDVINNLINQINNLQKDINLLKNKIALYE